jgi:hypothetical protein
MQAPDVIAAPAWSGLTFIQKRALVYSISKAISNQLRPQFSSLRIDTSVFSTMTVIIAFSIFFCFQVGKGSSAMSAVRPP